VDTTRGFDSSYLEKRQSAKPGDCPFSIFPTDSSPLLPHTIEMPGSL